MEIYLKFMTFSVSWMHKCSFSSSTNRWVATIKLEPDSVMNKSTRSVTFYRKQHYYFVLQSPWIFDAFSDWKVLWLISAFTLIAPSRFEAVENSLKSWNNRNPQVTWSYSFRPLLSMLPEPRQELGGFFFPSTTRPDSYLRVPEKCVIQSSCIFSHAQLPQCIHSRSAIRLWCPLRQAPAGFDVVLWRLCPLH